MKKLIAFFLSLITLLTLTACGNPARTGSSPKPPDVSDRTPPAESQGNGADASAPISNAPAEQESKPLIVYFSIPEDVDTNGVDAISGASIVVNNGKVLGNTEYVAQIIQQTVGGDLFRIETVDAYPLDHDPLVDQAAQEQADGARPQLASRIEDLDQYNTILLGYPNWWSDMPMPLYSFLEEYDLSGKTIIPFITHGGSRASRTVEAIAQLQPDASIWDDPLVLSRNDVAGSAAQVTAWAEGLNLNK